MGCKSILGNSWYVTRSQEVVMVQPTLHHVPAKQTTSDQNPLLQGWSQFPAGPEGNSRDVEECPNAPAPHPVPVLHVPDELELVQGDLRVLPLELWTLPVLVKLFLPFCSCGRGRLAKKGPVCHTQTRLCQSGDSS